MKALLITIATLILSVVPLRAADIITCADDVGDGEWVCFRKEFNISSNKSNIENTLRIAADSKYWLYVNGEPVVREGQLKRGPNPRDTYIDSLSLPNLKQGKNTVAVLVWYWNKGGYSHRSSQCAGLYFDLRAGKDTLASDTTWKARVHPAFYVPSGNRPNSRLPETNIGYNAAKDPEDFTDTLYNDSAWANAVAITADSADWNAFVPRPIPLFKDYGVKNYISSHRYGNDVYCYLPYNAQVSPVLRVKSPGGKVIGIRTDLYFTQGNDYTVRYEYRTKEGEQYFEFPGWVNGHSVIYTIPEGVEVIELAYRESGYNCSLAGSFDCSDEMLNKLWRKAQRTLYITMRDNFMDCPDRERAQYIGDVTNELAEVPYALSPEASLLIRKCAREFVDWQKKDSVLYAPVPSGSWTKELPQQSLSFCGLGLWDYYLYYGDASTINYAYPALKKYLHLWNVQADSLVDYRRGSWDWGDWGNNVDLRSLNQAWYSLTLGRYSKMARLIGDSAECVWADTVRKNLNAAFYSKYWNGKSFKTPNTLLKDDDRAQAMAVLAGIAPQMVFPKLRELFSTTEFASPYMERFVLEALCEMNYPQDALDRMRRRYRAMADSVYTTLWERFELAQNSTYNHAWSGAPLIVLSKHIAGITPLLPEFREFQIKPQLCDLEYIRTVVPTKYGNISLYVCRKDGFSMRLDVPKGTNARLLLPSVYTAWHLNGKEMKPELSDDTTCLEINLSSGYYVIDALNNDADTLNIFPRLADNVKRMEFLRRNVSAGNGVGNAPEENYSYFKAKADSLVSLPTDSIDNYAAVFRLREMEIATDEICNSIITPGAGEWFRVSACGANKMLEVSDCDTSRFVSNGIWIAEAGDVAKSFGMFNAASGDIFSECFMRVVPAGHNRVALQSMDDGKWLRCETDSVPEWTEADIDSIEAAEFGYTFERIEKAAECYRDTIGAGEWNAVILPTRIDSVSTPGVSVYRICRLVRNSSNEVTGIAVSEIGLDTTCVAAGVPVIFHADSAAGKAVPFSFYSLPATNVSYVKAVSNGLYGVVDTTKVKQDGTLYFRSGKLVRSDSSEVVLPRQCYVAPKRIQTRDWKVSDIIPVSIDGNTNAVKSVTYTKNREYVDVYTLDGIRVKKHVKRSNIMRKLKKGVYIIDGKKRIVK